MKQTDTPKITYSSLDALADKFDMDAEHHRQQLLTGPKWSRDQTARHEAKASAYAAVASFLREVQISDPKVPS